VIEAPHSTAGAVAVGSVFVVRAIEVLRNIVGAVAVSVGRSLRYTLRWAGLVKKLLHCVDLERQKE
jgi:hypothetical protein